MSDVHCDAIDYPLPFLEARLLARDLADDVAEAAELAGEVKRFLVLSAVNPAGWPMWSYRVDAAWHELILFTQAYARFCRVCFGRVLAHEPEVGAVSSRAERVTRETTAPRCDTLAGGFTAKTLPSSTLAPSRDDFAAAYHERFGRPLPALWDDAASVRADRRLRNPAAGSMCVSFVEGDRVEMLDAAGNVLVRVGSRAGAALRFVAAQRTFCPRELPELPVRDAVALCAALVKLHALEPCW